MQGDAGFDELCELGCCRVDKKKMNFCQVAQAVGKLNGVNGKTLESDECNAHLTNTLAGREQLPLGSVVITRSVNVSADRRSAVFGSQGVAWVVITRPTPPTRGVPVQIRSPSPKTNRLGLDWGSFCDPRRPRSTFRCLSPATHGAKRPTNVARRGVPYALGPRHHPRAPVPVGLTGDCVVSSYPSESTQAMLFTGGWLR